MSMERNARETHAAVTALRLRLETLCHSAQLGLPVNESDVFELLTMARLSNHYSARSLLRQPRDIERRDTRLPPFDGLEDAQFAARRADTDAAPISGAAPEAARTADPVVAACAKAIAPELES